MMHRFKMKIYFAIPKIQQLPSLICSRYKQFDNDFTNMLGTEKEQRIL